MDSFQQRVKTRMAILLSAGECERGSPGTPWFLFAPVPRLAFLRRICVAVLLCICLHSGEAVGGLPQASPETVGMSADHLERIDAEVAKGIAAGEMPGCVVCIGRQGKVVFLKAYGDRQVEPERVAMTTDTLFDLASITKPVATATSVMLLVERGELRLGDRVSQRIPEFAQAGKEDITVRDLLLHQSGLIPDNPLSDYEDGPEKAWERIWALPIKTEPGTRFVYSDVGFLVLGELVRRVSGQDVHAFSQANIFGPLGMRETGYLPAEALRQRAAPTEQRGGQWMRGEVHDPRANLLGGIAGHAGLFSTAEDLAVYAQMMLECGAYGGVRVLHPQTISQLPPGIESPAACAGWVGTNRRATPATEASCSRIEPSATAGSRGPCCGSTPASSCSLSSSATACTRTAKEPSIHLAAASARSRPQPSNNSHHYPMPHRRTC